MTANILLMAALWIAAFACSISTILFVLFGPSRYVWLSVFLAVVGVAIGGMGVSTWTPFGYFPEIGYTRSSDTFEFSVRSRWLFIAPLILGGSSLLLALWKHRRTRHAA
jgi:hypothetical protein